MKKTNTKVAAFIESISFEEVYDYYILQNHTKQQCYKYFNTTERIFRAFLEHYNLKKPRQLVYKLCCETKLLRYNDATYNNHAKYIDTCLKKFGATSALANKEIHQQTIDTQKQKYGSTGFGLLNNTEKIAMAKIGNQALWARYHKDKDFALAYQKKQNSTKTLHKSFNTSKVELNMFNILCDKFGSNDVITQYYDARYPFACDFYVKSLDLFIELNAH